MPALAAIAEACVTAGCVLAREAALPQAFVHVSAFAGIAGMLSPNILTLRLLSVLSSSSALLFNLWNRMLSPVFWNLTFIAVNLSRIAQLLLASQDSVTLDANEQRLYELGFVQYGVSLRDYATLLREAAVEWREYAVDEQLVREGDPMPLVWYVVEGEVEAVSDKGQRVHSLLAPGKGGWCGESRGPNSDRVAPVDIGPDPDACCCSLGSISSQGWRALGSEPGQPLLGAAAPLDGRLPRVQALAARRLRPQEAARRHRTEPRVAGQSPQ